MRDPKLSQTDWKTLNRKILFFTWLFGVLVALIPLLGRSAESEEAPTQENVILLTLDGVRWQELFLGADTRITREPLPPGSPMPWLTGEGKQQGFLLGGLDPDTRVDSPLFVSNPHRISLPAYETIFTGRVQPHCGSNRCGNVHDQTLQERVQEELQLAPHQVATLGSWEQIRTASERADSPGTSRPFVNVEHEPLEDHSELEADLRRDLNAREKKERPLWFNSRRDSLTWAHALRYWRVHHPRLLVISLVDSDEWGHLGRYKDYLKSLRQYDRWIQELTRMLDLDPSGHGARTTLFITTDHGRGYGPDWTSHGKSIPGSERIWLYVRPAQSSRFHSEWTLTRLLQMREPHLDLRPTIETLLGLMPWNAPGAGRSWLPPLF